MKSIYMRIEDIKLEKITFADKLKKPDESTKEVLQLAKAAKIDIEKLLPKEPIYNFSFVIDAPASMANAFRRVFIDYIDVRVLRVDIYSDLETDDKFLSRDYFNFNLESIHIDQTAEKVTGSINVVNNSSTDLLQVRTSDINLIGAKIYCDYPFARLRPGKYLKVKNIYSVVAQGVANGRAKAVSGRVVYKNLDRTDESSMIADPRRFVVGYRTHRNGSDPLWPFDRACEYIINSCKTIREGIEKKDMLKVHVTQSLDTSEYEFQDEYLTATDLIRDYILEDDKDISRIASSIKSYERAIGTLLIAHPDHENLIINACNKIERDVKYIYGAVHKK